MWDDFREISTRCDHLQQDITRKMSRENQNSRKNERSGTADSRIHPNFHDRHEELFGQKEYEWKGFKIPVYTFDSPIGIEKVPPKLKDLFKEIEQDLDIKLI